MLNINPSYLLLFTLLLSFLPILIGMMTSYVKVSIILSILKNSFGVPQIPGFIAEICLASIITVITLQPIIIEIYQKASSEDFSKFSKNPPTIKDIDTYYKILSPWISFLEKNVGEKELKAINSIADTKDKNIKTVNTTECKSELKCNEPPFLDLIKLGPAFLLTELKQGVLIGLSLIIPFLIIDIAIANILTVLGVSLISPQLLSLPLKLALFVSVDGWLILVKKISASYV